MPRTRPRELALEPDAMAELLKPARIEILESLQVAGAATVAELAGRLGKPADSLYYHVRKLVSIGVLERREAAESNGSGGPGRNGAVYGVVARAVRSDLDPTSKRSREVWGRGAAAALRLAQRDVNTALESGEARTSGARRNLFLGRVKMRLNAKQLREVNAHLDAIHEILRTHAENEKGRLYAVTMALTPLEERTR